MRLQFKLFIVAGIMSAVLFILSGIPSFAASDSGTCGENLTWELSDDEESLYISGTGEMDDYVSVEGTGTVAPWRDYIISIKSVNIDKGVTSIGSSAFCFCSKLSEISIPETVKSIGESAFFWCLSLEQISLPEGITEINKSCFEDCSKLKFISIPESVDYIGESAFEDCSFLRGVSIPVSVTVIGDNAFKQCDDIRLVLYSGTEEAWNRVSIGKSNECLTGAEKMFGDEEGPINRFPEFGWYREVKRDYWYEGGVRQGTVNDPKGVWGDGTNRGREIYDPDSDGWYWLDSINDGAKAVGKEVWMPYIYQNEDNWNDSEKQAIAYESDEGMGEYVLNAIKNKSGKWVRYDDNGKMLKGWVTIEGALADVYPDQVGNVYYYDTRTGLMAKGVLTIDGVEYSFDQASGVLLGITLDEARRQILKRVNAERESAGVSPVTLNSELCDRADIRAKELVVQMSHTRPDGSTPDTVISGITHSYFGENIAGGQPSTEKVMDSWMDSPGHRANILNSQYTQLGVGIYYDESGWGYHWVQLFI